jgi:hypothetical protein
LKYYILVLIAFPFCSIIYAQEHIAPLYYNAFVHPAATKLVAPTSAHKTTGIALSLPFFEDFTNYSPLPDSNKWVEHQVYINNTMCYQPISRGVATFDALDQNGYPYDSNYNYTPRYCDSLTSKPIDLSGIVPSDSLYLSFFYQPQGNGFYPLVGDSLLLYMRKSYSDWQLVWSAPGTQLQPFSQVLIPITDTIFLYNAFQFRFVNIAALNYSDANWNIDYIKLNTGRNMYDTLIADAAFADQPTQFLSDYTSMPYRQFMVNPAVELSSQYTAFIRNNYNFNQSVNYSSVSRETITNTPLNSDPLIATSIPTYQTQSVVYNTYTNTVPMAGIYDKVDFENKLYIQSIAPSDPSQNDTIVCNQVFDNYLAYDDGTAEKSYYLTQFSTLPAYLSIEYHLNKPDTLQGLAIYFGRQIPLPFSKFFSIIVYSSLNSINGGTSDNIVYRQDNLVPGYVDTINHFWVYSFNKGIPMPAGLFYIGTMQPAFGGSDSLYFGLDLNRVGTNHAYYNVSGNWTQSQISGAIMMRPLLGPAVVSTAIPNIAAPNTSIQLWPNPALDELNVSTEGQGSTTYAITDLSGKAIINGSFLQKGNINVNNLPPGLYLISFKNDKGFITETRKWIKQ